MCFYLLAINGVKIGGDIVPPYVRFLLKVFHLILEYDQLRSDLLNHKNWRVLSTNPLRWIFTKGGLEPPFFQFSIFIILALPGQNYVEV
jgi:hypothetical protein